MLVCESVVYYERPDPGSDSEWLSNDSVIPQSDEGFGGLTIAVSVLLSTDHGQR